MTEATRTEDRYLDHPYELAGRLIDPIAGVVIYGELRTSLNRKLLEVLACLCDAGIEMVPRERFIERVWRGNSLIGENGLTHAVHSLRRALQDTDSDKPLIRTIPRRGYQLTTRAHPVDDSSTAAFAPGIPVAGRPGWLLSRRLGGNAVSETWLAEEQTSGEKRMFRFCRSEQHLQALRRETTVLRYLREALGKRDDTAVVIDWQLEEPPYHLELDYSTGGNLAEWSAARGGLARIPLYERLRLAGEIATALAAVHAAEVIHRNLSPGSILIDAAGEGRAAHARLGEFGMSDVTDRTRLEALNITRAGLTLTGDEGDADALYLAPECLTGEAATPASDVHALGVLLLQLVTGDLQRSPDAGLPDDQDADGLGELIARCLDAEPDRRPTAAAVSERLRAVAVTSAADAPATADPAPSQQDMPALSGEPEPTVGRMIGPYRLVDQLGEGGMGTVYLAEQHTPVQRKVALKVVRAGLMSADVRARFEAERQALALMNHANVAAVYDAGNTPSGQPYFAMEYVQGQEITAHCDRLKLDIRERIALFLQVCEGVLHAHQKGLIHRDIKPGNILVSRANDQPTSVKIIDFGVAKSISGILASQPAHTRLGSFVGTPAYSSPEQVSGPVASVDTRSDIYSLGVVLYELLAGVTPYSEEELNRKTPVELARLLSGDHAPSPLLRFTSLSHEEETRIASHRSQSVDQLKALLNTDVTWIVGKCLEIDPEERYPTVLALENDLRRWLEDQPVLARPTSQLYRMRKFVMRHRLGVALASLGTLALLTATGAAIYGYVRAERALETAEKAAEFQVKQIQSLDPAAMGLVLRTALKDEVRNQRAERGMSATEIAQTQQQLDRIIQGVNFTDLAIGQLNTFNFKPSLEAIQKDYGDQPLLQAQLWSSMADTMFLLGQYNAAVEPYERALAQRRKLLGAEHPLTLDILEKRGKLRRELSDLDGSAKDLQTVMDLARRVLGKDHPQTLSAMHALAMTLYKQGKFKEAQAYARKALETRRRVLGEDHPDTLTSLRETISFTLQSGTRQKALADAEDSLRKHRLKFGNQDSRTLMAMSATAMVYYQVEKLAEAEALVRELIRTRSRLLGDRHPQTLSARSNLATVLQEANRPDEAEAQLRQVLDVTRTLYSEENPEVLDIRSNIAEAILNQGRYAEAESIYRDIIVTQERILGKDSEDTLRSVNGMARVLGLQERYKEAAEWYRRALDARRRLQGNDHRNTLVTLQHLAYVLRRSGNSRDAAKFQLEAMETNRRVRGVEDSETLLAMLDYGLLLREQGDNAGASKYLREVLAIQRRVLGSAHQDTLITIAELIGISRTLGKLDEADSLGRELTEAAPRIFDSRKAQIGGFYIEHAYTLIELRRFKEAERMFDLAKANLLQATNTPSANVKGNVEMLIEGYILLYERWHTARPGAGYDAKVALWRSRLDTANKAGEGSAAAALLGASPADE